MKKSKKAAAGISREDCSFGMLSGSASTLVQSKPYNRKNQFRKYNLFALHKPTEVRVSLEIEGQYSKSEWKKRKEDTWEELFLILEKEVEKYVRRTP